jgi:anti-sigma B factor antagonist
MAFKLNARQTGDVTVIDFSGPITLSVASNVIRETVRDLVAKGQKKILLNMGSVAYIDSYGIGEMVAGYSSVRNAGGTLKLLSLSKSVKEMLEITNLYAIFDVQENEETAVRSFK